MAAEYKKKEIQLAKFQIQSLQVFRGFASLAVVAHHAALSTEAFVGALPISVSALLGFGLLGVDFFFVLSGFIIMYAHMDDDRSPGSVARYGFKRLTRIYPAYLPVGVGMVFLYMAMPSLSASVGGRDFSLASSLFLVPADGPPALSVAWTLVHELMFYGVFLLFFLSWQWLVGGLLLWAMVILVANHSFALTGWSRYPLSILNIEFMFGVGAAWLVRSEALLGKGQWIAALGVTIAGLALWLMTAAYLHLIFALGLTLLIVGFAVREQSIAMRWPASLLILGNASYSIYLIHNPLLSLTQRLAGRMGLSWSAAMVLGVVLSLLAGWIYHLMIERPGLRFFQKRLRSQ